MNNSAFCNETWDNWYSGKVVRHIVKVNNPNVM